MEDNIQSSEDRRRALAQYETQSLTKKQALANQQKYIAQGKVKSKILADKDVGKYDGRVDIASDDEATLRSNEYDNTSALVMLNQGIMGFGQNLVSGFLQGLGSITALPAYFMDDYDGNWLMDLGEKLQANPIITDPFGSRFSYGNLLNDAQNLATSVGIIAESIAEQYALTYLTGLSGGAAASVQGAALASKLNTLRKLFGTATVLYGGMKEAYANSVDTYKQTYEALLQNGISADEAKSAAKDAAKLGFERGVAVNMALNALTFGTAKYLGSTSALTKSGRKLASAIGGPVLGGLDETIELIGGKYISNMSNKWLRAGTEAVVEAIGEGFDEGYQSFVNLDAKYEVMSRYGLEGEYNREVLGDEFIESGVIGAFSGGVAFPAGGKILGKAWHKVSGRENADYKAEFVRTAMDETIADVKAIDAIMRNPNATKEEKEEARQKSFALQVKQIRNAVRADASNTDGDDAVEFLVTSYDSAIEGLRQGNQEVMDQWGVNDETKDQVIKNIEELKKIALEYKDTFIQSYENFGDFNLAEHMATRKAQSSKFIKDAEDHRGSFKEYLNNNPFFAENKNSNDLLELAAIEKYLEENDKKEAENDTLKEYLEGLRNRKIELDAKLKDENGFINEGDQEVFDVFNENDGENASLATQYGYGYSAEILGKGFHDEYLSLNGNGDGRKNFFNASKKKRQMDRELYKQQREARILNNQIDNVNLDHIDASNYGDFNMLADMYDEQSKFKRMNRTRNRKVEDIRKRIQDVIKAEEDAKNNPDLQEDLVEDQFNDVYEDVQEQGIEEYPTDLPTERTEVDGSFSQEGKLSKREKRKLRRQERRAKNKESRDARNASKNARKANTQQEIREDHDPSGLNGSTTSVVDDFDTVFGQGVSISEQQPIDHHQDNDPFVGQHFDAQDYIAEPQGDIFSNVGPQQPRATIKAKVQEALDAFSVTGEDTEVKVIDGDHHQGVAYTTEGAYAYRLEPDGTYNARKINDNYNTDEHLEELERKARDEHEARNTQYGLQEHDRRMQSKIESENAVRAEMADQHVKDTIGMFLNVAPGTQLTEQQKQQLSIVLDGATHVASVLTGKPVDQVTIEDIGLYIYDQVPSSSASNVISMLSKAMSERYNIPLKDVVTRLGNAIVTRGNLLFNGDTSTDTSTQVQTNSTQYTGPQTPNGLPSTPNTIVTSVGIVAQVPGVYRDGVFIPDSRLYLTELNPATSFLDTSMTTLPEKVKDGDKIIYKVLDPQEDKELYDSVLGYYHPNGVGSVDSDNVPIVAFNIGADGKADKPLFIVPRTFHIKEGHNDANRDRQAINQYNKSIRDIVAQQGLKEFTGSIQSIGNGKFQSIADTKIRGKAKILRKKIHSNVDYFVVTSTRPNGEGKWIIDGLKNMRTGEFVDGKHPMHTQNVHIGAVVEITTDNKGKQNIQSVYPLGDTNTTRTDTISGNTDPSAQPFEQKIIDDYAKAHRLHSQRMRAFHGIVGIHMMYSVIMSVPDIHLKLSNKGVKDREAMIAAIKLMTTDQDEIGYYTKLGDKIIRVPHSFVKTAKAYLEYLEQGNEMYTPIEIEHTASLFHHQVTRKIQNEIPNTIQLEFDDRGGIRTFILTSARGNESIYNAGRQRNSPAFFRTTDLNIKAEVLQTIMDAFAPEQPGSKRYGVLDRMTDLFNSSGDEARNRFNIPMPSLSEDLNPVRPMRFEGDNIFPGRPESLTMDHIAEYGLLGSDVAMYEVTDDQGRVHGVTHVNPNIQYVADIAQPIQQAPVVSQPVTPITPVQPNATSETVLGSQVPSNIPTPVQTPVPTIDVTPIVGTSTDTTQTTQTVSAQLGRGLHTLHKFGLGTSPLANKIRALQNQQQKAKLNVGVTGNQMQFTEEDVADIKASLNTPTGISIEGFNNLVDHYVHLALTQVKNGNKKLDGPLIEVIETEYAQEVQRAVASVLNEIEELLNDQFDPAVAEELKESLQETADMLHSITNEENVKLARESAFDVMKDKFSIKEDTIEETEESWAYSEESFQLDPRSSIPNTLRIFLSDIKTQNEGFLGIQSYMGFNEAYRTLVSFFTGDNGPIENSKDALLNRLYDNSIKHPWVADVITNGLGYKIVDENGNITFEGKDITSAQELLMNQMLYQFTQTEMDYVQVLYETETGLETSVIDPNSNKPQYVLRSAINNNVLSSSFFYIESVGKRTVLRWNKDQVGVVFNTDKYKEFVKNYSGLTEFTDVAMYMSEILGEFGIRVDYRMFLETSQSEKTFSDTAKKGALNLFDNLNRGIKSIVLNNASDSSLTMNFSEDDMKTFPFSKHNYNSGITISFLSEQASMMPELQVLHMSDAGKKVYMISRTTHSDEINRDLSSGAIIEKVINDPYISGSYIIQALQAGELNIDTHMKVKTLPLTAMKEKGSLSTEADKDFVSISRVEKMIASVALFFSKEQSGSPGWKNGYYTTGGLPFRFATIPFPNMSDKGTMKVISMPVINTKDKSLGIMQGTTVDISRHYKFKEFVLQNKYRNELGRVEEVLRGTNDFSQDIADTTISSRMFVDHPFLNNVQVEGKTIQQHILDGTYDTNKIAIENEVVNAFNQYYNQQIQATIDQWLDAGMIKKSAQIDGTPAYELIHLPHDLDNRLLSPAGMSQIAFDYMFNTQLSKITQSALISGDSALYGHDNKMSKALGIDKAILTEPDIEKRNRLIVDALANADERTILRTVAALAENRNKRLADMIAPGMQIADSANNSYLHIPLADVGTVDRAIDYKIKLYHPEKLEAFNEAVKGLTKNTEAYDNAVRAFFKKHHMPAIEAYLDNPSTDAQEYTTVKEHLYVLHKKGTINRDQYNRLVNIYEQGGEFSSEDLKVIMQPEKPVYVGFRDHNGKRVMTYIKSSSIPLLPQITKGTEMDTLRVAMEDIERASGKSVRAAYHSATKTGDVTSHKRLDMSNIGNLTAEDITHSMNDHIIELDRTGFYIQMNVPYDHHEVSLGTQMMKLLFSSGVTKIRESVFEYNGKQYNGSQLLEEYNGLFRKLQERRRGEFFKELGLNPKTGAIKNSRTYVLKLSNMLMEEAISRGWSQEEIEGLKPTKNLGYKSKKYGFKIPLWFSPNSSKYESLLNSVINKQLMQMKMPGTSYVVSSEHGIKWKSEADLDSGIRSRIIYTDGFNGEYLQPATFEEYTNDKGEKKSRVKRAQVFVSSKLRGPDGKLIDLYEKKANGEYVYLKEENGRLFLNKDMVSPELLNMTSFRIPTSGHMSMSNVEIAGILPPEAGDTMIVPANFTTQKGLDFDIDKEYSYQYHLEKLPDGRLVRLRREEGKTYDKETETKILENELIELHESVLSSPDERVQSLINKVLSIEFTKMSRDALSSNSKFVSLHTEDYNLEQTELGKVGRMGIGVYSNAVTFQGLLEQLESVKSTMGHEFDYTVPINDAEGNQRKMSLPGIKADIALAIGRGTTLNLDGRKNAYLRAISEVLGELQNTATDNAKEMIMGLMNITGDTIGVHTMLTLLGVDSVMVETKDGPLPIHYPYLMMTQPIIKELAERMSRTKSDFGERLSMADVVMELENKYYAEYSEDYEHNSIDDMYKDSVDPKSLEDIDFRRRQLNVLRTFVELNNLHSEIRKVQTALSVHGKGLGQTAFESQEQMDGLKSLATAEETMPGITALLGETVEEKPKDGLFFELAENKYIVPTTPVGVAVVSAIESTKIWKPFFIQYDDTVRSVINSVLGKSVFANAVRKAEHRKAIFKEMKKYFMTMFNTNLYSPNIDYDRAELLLTRYADSGKTAVSHSLASYFGSQVKTMPELQDNVLIKHLVPKVSTKATDYDELRLSYSMIDKNNSRVLVQSFIDLVEKNLPLPDRNGRPYTTRDLARDLVRYSFIVGGTNNPFSFVRYIPTEMLEVMGFNEGMRGITPSGGDRGDIFQNSVFNTQEKIDAFTQQVFRNNPRFARKISLGEKSDFKFDPDSGGILYSGSKEAPAVITFKHGGNVMLGFRTEDTNHYSIVSALGQGMVAEYSYGVTAPTRATEIMFVNDIEIKSIPKVQGRTTFTRTDEMSQYHSMLFDDLIKDGNRFTSLDHFFENFANKLKMPDASKNKHIKALKKMIDSYGKLGGKQVQIELRESIGRNDNALAGFIPSDDDSSLGTIVLTKSLLSDQSSIEDIVYNIQHEFVHALTVTEIQATETALSNDYLSQSELETKRIRSFQKLNRIREFLYRVLHTSEENGVYETMSEKNKQYGLTDNFELLAEFFSNAEFRDMLGKIKYTGNVITTKKMMIDVLKKMVNNHLKSLDSTQQADYTDMIESEVDSIISELATDLDQLIEGMDEHTNMADVIGQLISNFMEESVVQTLINTHNASIDTMGIDISTNSSKQTKANTETKIDIGTIFTCM